MSECLNNSWYKINDHGKKVMATANSNTDSKSSDEDAGKIKKKNVKTSNDQKGKLKTISPNDEQSTNSEVQGHGPGPEPSTSSFEDGLMFRCHEFGDEVLSYRDWQIKFKDQLILLKESDDILAAILTIKSLNQKKEADECIGLIEKYVTNLINNPGVDKYKFIRLANQIFNEKVLSTEGGLDFLISIGFQTAVGGSDNTEPYLVYNPSKSIDLDSVLKSLKSVTGFELELDRDMKISNPRDEEDNEEFSDEFYEWTMKDMKKEQKTREEEMEKKMQLRRRKKTTEKADYTYTKIRVKFPDGMTVEAVFSANEKLYNLKSFLLSKFYFYENFNFMALPSKIFDVLDEEKTFAELKLVPSVTLMLKWKANSPGPKYAFKESS